MLNAFPFTILDWTMIHHPLDAYAAGIFSSIA
jgi:hypothetical protein